MYRDWREITKKLLSKNSSGEGRISKLKLKRPETQLYLKWIKGEIERDRAQFNDYTKGKGIIATRERFLKWMETRKANSQAKEAAVDKGASASNVTFGKTIILPIAVPGAGEPSVLFSSWGPVLTRLQAKHPFPWLSNTSFASAILKATTWRPKSPLPSSSRMSRLC